MTDNDAVVTIIDAHKNIIQVKQHGIESPELVLKYEHLYPPHLYAIHAQGYVDKDGKYVVEPTGEFTTIKFENLQYPVFVGKDFNPNKYRPNTGWKFYVGASEYEEYLKHLDLFNFEHRHFVEKAKNALKRATQEFITQPAKFVTRAYLYDRDDWEQANETGEKISPIADGISFCSVSEKNFIKAKGRELAFKRAVEDLAYALID